MSESNRVHYLDNLRALAMLAGVLFHAALAYSPLMHPYWPAADRSRSAWVDVAVWFPHLFRMPLFFAIAGYFAARQVNRRGVAGMLRNRVARVLLPLLLFWPLVSVSIRWLTGQAASTVRNASPVLELLRRSELPSLPPSLTHLWFLYYLMWFYLLVWIAAAGEWKAPAGWIRAWKPAKLLGIAPLLLVPSLASVSAPAPAPESVLPQLWALVFHGLFFVFGYGLYSSASILAELRPYSAWLGIASAGGYAAFLLVLKTQSSRTEVQILGAVLQAYLGVWMTLWCLQAGSYWMNARVAWVRYLADGSYWTYLVHLPLLLAIQYRLLDWDLAWPAKWAISVVATMAACLASYHFGVRRTMLGRLLNGRPTSSAEAGALIAREQRW